MYRIPTQCASGSLFGLAFGDALGAGTEFLSVEQILRRFPPYGPQELEGKPARVTDDTQMALAVSEALLEVAQAGQPFTAASLEGPLRKAFIAWNNSPENTRAPGMTCMRACENLETGMPWYEATVADSKGCGANMRVAPVGLLQLGKDTKTRAAIAQFQAALTHGHPTALAAADLTAYAIAHLAHDGYPEGLPRRLREYAMSQRTIYHADWLGQLWQRPGINSSEEFIARGWDECLRVLYQVDHALEKMDWGNDPCLATGAGWIAEEALATGLLCFLMFPEDPAEAIRRAALTSGDSDSIAYLTGAFAGAYCGLSKWPEEWIERIEYRDRLAKLGETWDV